MEDDAGDQVRVRKWRRELKPVGPGGHLEIMAWVPEVPLPTMALQQSRNQSVDPKGVSATTKKHGNSRKRAAADGQAARMTRSLRHNTTNGSELWGQLPSGSTRTVPRGGKEEKKLEIHMALEQGQHHYDSLPASSAAPSASSSKPTSPTPAPLDAPVVPVMVHNNSSEFLVGMIPFDGSADDDDDEGYRTLSPSSSPEVSASPSPAGSPM
ncbi:hypothetical protein ACHHYP_04959 [Achlya hypogyna]|uniref:Uncharacterized protein n=1 Tax=Achlya hypogyna TaxID=1202772 RepID=A0A1V9YZM3_ACHHY|nr:hypothetical protein ACHHYP_04959 [Achlya hypogyna]